MPASRKYTVDEANALVAWLEATFVEISRQRTLVESALTGLAGLGRHTRANGHGDTDEKLRDAKRVAEAARERLRELLGSVVEKDIEVRDLATGLVDFLGERDGRDVWLCWRAGEPAVGHWHELDRGFSDRKPL